MSPSPHHRNVLGSATVTSSKCQFAASVEEEVKGRVDVVELNALVTGETQSDIYFTCELSDIFFGHVVYISDYHGFPITLFAFT